MTLSRHLRIPATIAISDRLALWNCLTDWCPARVPNLAYRVAVGLAGLPNYLPSAFVIVNIVTAGPAADTPTVILCDSLSFVVVLLCACKWYFAA